MRKTVLILTVILSLALVLMSCGKKTTKPEDTPNVLDSNTIVLSGTVLEAVQSWGENDEYLSIPAGAETQGLAVGKIIVGGPSANFPDGFLRKITAMDVTEDSYTAVTEPASIAEALESGYLAFSHTLSPDRLVSTQAALPGVKLVPNSKGTFGFQINTVLYDEDNNPNTTNDQVVFNGTVDLDLGFAGHIHVQGNRLKGMRIVANEELDVNADVSSSVSFFGIDHQVQIFSQAFQPIVFFMGPFPVVMTPVLDMNLNLNGNATATITLGYNYTNTVSAGIKYENNSWTPIHTIDEDGNSDMEDPLAFNISYRTSLQPQLSVLLYGLAGPYVALGAYGEIVVDPLQSVWWKLLGGFYGEAGLNTTVLDDVLPQAGPWELFDTSFIIRQAANPIQGTLLGQVKDAVTLQGIPGVNVGAFVGNELISSGSTDANGQFQFDMETGTGYRILFTKDGYHDVTYNNVAVYGNQETTLETVMQIDESYAGVGTINGHIYNALNGQPVSDVNLVFRTGLNTSAGNTVGSVSTDSYGYYSIATLSTGNYTAEASRDDFVTTYFNVVVVGGETMSGQDGVITPIMDATEIRVVLTWGATPSDLDSHITGPNPAGGRFHVYYANSDFYYNDVQYCALDYDDVTSYGPETITIYTQNDGLYRYSVHDYTNRYSTTSYALSNSGATVRVYFGSNLVQTFFVPSNQIGTLWTVFELYGTQIVPKNIMSNESDPYSITKDDQTDGALLQDLPKK
ncbi:MAG: carboxypeptidase regulatory-like domain-containing protein [Candidatus Syntrophosphaera sp.]|nr:carboxypeptidase regulatory-like domain-containing protein [Candidatus Syntrophosphaera sp.]